MFIVIGAIAMLSLASTVQAGLVAHWPMDEVVGDTVYDASGYNCNGVATNTSIGQGVIDSCRAFDGSTSYVDLPCLVYPTQANTGSLSCWFKVNNLNHQQTIINKSTYSSDILFAMVNIAPDGGVIYQTKRHGNSGYGAGKKTNAGTVNAGTWYHLAITADGSNPIRFYMDGNEVGTSQYGADDSGARFFDLGTSWVLGKFFRTTYNPGTDYLDGAIDDVRLYSTPLTSEEVRDLFCEGRPGACLAVWIDSTTVNVGYSQVMMRNTNEVSAFTIALKHNSPWNIDSVSRIGCRTENWESFNKTINNAAKTVLFGGMANFGGGTPCMPPGEGCVAKIYWHKNCDIYATVCFDTTFISSASQLLVVDCEIPSHELPVEFVKGCSKYQTYLFGDVNGDNQVDLSDVVYLVNHIFLLDAPPPIPSPCAGDVNGDCKTNLTDAVSLVNYIFTGTPVPVAYCSQAGEFSKRVVDKVEIGTTNTSSDQFSILTVSTTAGQQIKGAQLEFTTSGNVEIVDVTNNVAGMQEFHGTVDGKFKVGLLDLQGEVVIPVGTNNVVTIKYKGAGGIKLVNAIMVGTDAAEMNVTISSDKSQPSLPTAFSLAQNSPNPLNPTTEIAFAVPHSCPVRLEILNVLGQSVRTLVDEFKAAGNYQVTWDSRDNNSESVSSGVYFYRLSAGDFADTKKMVLMK